MKIEFQKIHLLFSKFKKQFFNFQLQTVEDSDTCNFMINFIKILTQLGSFKIDSVKYRQILC